MNATFIRDDKPILLTIDLNDLENSCEELEAKLSSSEARNIGVTAGKVNALSAEHLSKI